VYSMSNAPRSGETFEALFEGEWHRVFWSERADDGSPYGTEGFADDETGYIILDLEGWRHLPESGSKSYQGESPLSGHTLKQPIIVFGLSFGDEAKGSTVDYLSSAIPDASAVVRWSGGANAAHNVRHGHRHHTFRQFGSGTFLGLPTFLMDTVVVNLNALMDEAVELEGKGVLDPLALVRIDGDALITTPIHMALNRAREILRGRNRHGSTGVGIGETIVQGYAEKEQLSQGDWVGNFEIVGPTFDGEGRLSAESFLQVASEDRAGRILSILEHQAAYAAPLIERARSYCPELADELSYGPLEDVAAELLAIADSASILPHRDFEEDLIGTMDRGTVIFEGSQGLLLDEKWGFHPHTTWAHTEPSGLVDWLSELGHDPYVLGLMRSYTTRHGAGPLPSLGAVPLSEDSLPVDDNSWGRWQGGFRVAPLDLPLLSYARTVLSFGGIELDGISVSHLDAFLDEDGDSNGIPVVSIYGAELDPSNYWTFSEVQTGHFATMNSNDFLENSIIDKPYGLMYCTEKTLLSDIQRRTGAAVVLVARGPRRMDRELVIPENGDRP